MSYVNKKVSLYGTAYEFLEQIAQTFENNTVIPFTVTRTNLPYNESVTDIPSVTCDWDNVRIVIKVRNTSSTTSLFDLLIMQKNLNNNKYEDVFSSYSFSLKYQNTDSYNNKTFARKLRFIFCKNNEAVNIIIRNYNESFGAGIFSDVTTSESPIRLFGYYVLNSYNQIKIQDSSFDSYYRISYYNPPIESNQIILKYQANVNYYYDSSNIKYLTTLKNMSSISFGNSIDVNGALYNLTTKSGKKTYLINNTVANSATAYYGLGLETGSEVT